jgi:hypothetical protein
MSLTAFNGFWVPPPISNLIAIDATTLLVDASGEKAACIFRAPATGNLKKVGFLTGAVVQTQTIRVSFQDLDASGNADGTQDQFRDITVNDTDDNVWKETGIISSDGTDTGSVRSVTIEEWLAVVFEHNPFNAGDVFRLSGASPDIFSTGLFAYMSNFAAAAWTRRTFTPILALYYASDVLNFSDGLATYLSAAGESFSSSSNPAERGLKFKFPVQVNVGGMGVTVTPNNPARDFDLVLYDSDGTTPLATVSFDANNIRAVSVGFCRGRFADLTLAADTYYYIMVKPTTTGNITTNLISFNAAGLMDQMWGGQNWHYATKQTTTVTPDTTKRPQISVFVTGIHGAGGSGGPVQLVNSGGLVG